MANIISEHLKQEVVTDVNLLLRDLLKVIKVLTLYPADNPLPAKMRDSVGARMIELVNRFDGLQFAVNADELVYQNETVFSDKSKEEALASLLYQSGIIMLEFRPRLTREEFDTFLDLVKTYINDRSPERDLVSLLWQAQLDGIKFRTVEDVALSAYSADMIVQELRSDDQSRRDFSADIIYNTISLDDQPEPLAPSTIDAAQEMGLSLEPDAGRPDPFQLFLGRQGEIPDDEQAHIQKLLQEDRYFDYCRAVTRILLETLQTWDDQQPLVETVAICEKVLDELLNAGAFAAAADFIHSLRAIQEERRSSKPAFADRLTEFFQHAGDFRRIEYLTEIINRQETVDTGALELYLEALGWESLAHIIGMLGKLVSKSARLMVCDYLARHGKENRHIIGSSLRDKRWYVARNAVMILGRIGGNEALRFLSGTVTHPDQRVRAETIRALTAIGTDDAVDILCRFLDDSDSELRLACLKHLEKIGGRKPFESLRSIVQSPDFRKFSLEEQEWFLVALSRLGGEEVVAFLATIAGSFQLFPGAAMTRFQLAALTALVHNRSEEAEQRILQLSRSRRRWLREAAAAALDQRRRLIHGGGDDGDDSAE
ncbi:MAG: HEAT repeat domain-containing protein [candidate division Zixibacteria bacterium]|nr:HEAT repeat domain-containing protein [candidate division Zixibacteria bacterium]